MKTLIIHPEDRTTSFLKVIYENIPDKTVITGGMNKEKVKELIASHDRVMMMGHGCPSGLFSMGRFFGTYGSLVIDASMVEELKKKDNSVFIWCNADQFVNRYNLKGFYTGMFISEVMEAAYCGLPGTDQEDVDQSNFGFCEIAAKYINEEIETAYNSIRMEYSAIADENPVALYNYNRLYHRLPHGETTI